MDKYFAWHYCDITIFCLKSHVNGRPLVLGNNENQPEKIRYHLWRRDQFSIWKITSTWKVNKLDTWLVFITFFFLHHILLDRTHFWYFKNSRSSYKDTYMVIQYKHIYHEKKTIHQKINFASSKKKNTKSCKNMNPSLKTNWRSEYWKCNWFINILYMSHRSCN